MNESQQLAGEGCSVDYHQLYLQEKELREEFQKKAHLAELKLRKMTQAAIRKCARCIHHPKQQEKGVAIRELREFRNGISQKLIGLTPKDTTKRHSIIQNFAVFGFPPSILSDPEELAESAGELLYASTCPNDITFHSAKLAFPGGIAPKFYDRTEAREKSIEIMSSNCLNCKSYIMGFEGDSKEQSCEVLKLMNPQNRLYAICISVEDFTILPDASVQYFESDKLIKSKGANSANPVSDRAFSQREISQHVESEYSIAVSKRVYCIFSKFPLFPFFEDLLKSMISSVKTERLVVYRESGGILSEADSEFFLERIKFIFRELFGQIQAWTLRLNKQFELKLITCQKLPLYLTAELCKSNYVEQWGPPIMSLFIAEAFLDVFTLMMLEEKIVFVSEDLNILTYTVHLFTRLLTQPLQYPYPSVCLLPAKEEYLNSPFPIVYGYPSSKKQMTARGMISKYRNTYVFLQREGVEIISADSNKNKLKKKPQSLYGKISPYFGSHKSNIQTGCTALCSDVIRHVNQYLCTTVVQNLPSRAQIQEIRHKLESEDSKLYKQINQEVFKVICRDYRNKSKQAFFGALLETQMINSYLFA